MLLVPGKAGALPAKQTQGGQGQGAELSRMIQKAFGKGSTNQSQPTTKTKTNRALGGERLVWRDFGEGSFCRQNENWNSTTANPTSVADLALNRSAWDAAGTIWGRWYRAVHHAFEKRAGPVTIA